MKRHLAVFTLLYVSSFIIMCENEAPRISKEEVKPLLGKSNVIILDVRRKSDWEKSDKKIKGAIFEDHSKFETWFNKYTKDKKLILYCA